MKRQTVEEYVSEILKRKGKTNVSKIGTMQRLRKVSAHAESVERVQVHGRYFVQERSWDCRILAPHKGRSYQGVE